MQEVLHYSALQTGVAWLAMSLTSIALAGVSQWLVIGGGAKIVMAIGMTLIGAGVIWASQAPVRGHFLDLAGPFVIAGAGTAFAFIPISNWGTRRRRGASGGPRVRAAEHKPAARRRARDRDRLERRREPHQTLRHTGHAAPASPAASKTRFGCSV
jgi:hypothetical protein